MYNNDFPDDDYDDSYRNSSGEEYDKDDFNIDDILSIPEPEDLEKKEKRRFGEKQKRSEADFEHEMTSMKKRKRKHDWTDNVRLREFTLPPNMLPQNHHDENNRFGSHSCSNGMDMYGKQNDRNTSPSLVIPPPPPPPLQQHQENRNIPTYNNTPNRNYRPPLYNGIKLQRPRDFADGPRMVTVTDHLGDQYDLMYDPSLFPLDDGDDDDDSDISDATTIVSSGNDESDEDDDDDVEDEYVPPPPPPPPRRTPPTNDDDDESDDEYEEECEGEECEDRFAVDVRLPREGKVKDSEVKGWYADRWTKGKKAVLMDDRLYRNKLRTMNLVPSKRNRMNLMGSQTNVGLSIFERQVSKVLKCPFMLVKQERKKLVGKKKREVKKVRFEMYGKDIDYLLFKSGWTEQDFLRGRLLNCDDWIYCRANNDALEEEKVHFYQPGRDADATHCSFKFTLIHVEFDRKNRKIVFEGRIHLKNHRSRNNICVVIWKLNCLNGRIPAFPVAMKLEGANQRKPKSMGVVPGYELDLS